MEIPERTSNLLLKRRGNRGVEGVSHAFLPPGLRARGVGRFDSKGQSTSLSTFFPPFVNGIRVLTFLYVERCGWSLPCAKP